MKILDYAQGSVEWMQARAGIPTASEFDALVTPEFKVRTGDMPKSYLAKKLAEAWLGGPLAQFNVFDMDQGKILEDEAIPWLELETNCTVKRVGLITTDDGKVGCSPDGLLVEAGLEVKCPRPETHAGYLLKGELPKDYRAQVHGGMYVTGYHFWTFLSYRRRFPALILTIERDDMIQAAIHEAVTSFLEQFDAGWQRLCEMNGGPPVRRPVQTVMAGEPKPAFIDPDDYRV